jgi:pimeloyl-ACP methyl ester carboxylesterase
MAIFVLVHGGGHGAWCWERLVPLLREAGHEVHTPILTGVGERFAELTPEVGLSTHIEDVVRLFEAEDLREVILVGHSYGGTVITGVAGRMPERIRELVFLDAPHPRHGENLCDASPGGLEVFEALKREVDGVELTLFPEKDIIAAFGLIDPTDIDWAAQHLTPHPMRCFLDRLDLADPAAVDAIPRTSIDCVETLARRGPEIVRRAKAADRCYEIDTGHDLMITEPRKTADMLLEIARNPATKR